RSVAQLAHDLLVEAEHQPVAAIGDQSHRPRLAGFEPHGAAGGDVQAHAAGLLAIEAERGVGLVEVIVRADLDRPVAGIGHFEGDGRLAGIELDLAVPGDDFAGYHGNSPQAALRPAQASSSRRTRSVDAGYLASLP